MSRAYDFYIHSQIEPLMTTTHPGGGLGGGNSTWAAKNRGLDAMRAAMGEEEWQRRVEEDKEYERTYRRD